MASAVLVSTDCWARTVALVNPSGTVKWVQALGSYRGGPSIGPQGQIYVNTGRVLCFVPEPSALFVLLTGGLALALRRRTG